MGNKAPFRRSPLLPHDTLRCYFHFKILQILLFLSTHSSAPLNPPPPDPPPPKKKKKKTASKGPWLCDTFGSSPAESRRDCHPWLAHGLRSSRCSPGSSARTRRTMIIMGFMCCFLIICLWPPMEPSEKKAFSETCGLEAWNLAFIWLDVQYRP